MKKAMMAVLGVACAGMACAGTEVAVGTVTPWSLCDADAGRLFVHALNLNADPVDAFRFRAAPSWAGASVEILCGAEWRPADAAAVWTGDELSVRAATPLFRTLVFRMVREDLVK